MAGYFDDIPAAAPKPQAGGGYFDDLPDVPGEQPRGALSRIASLFSSPDGVPPSADEIGPQGVDIEPAPDLGVMSGFTGALPPAVPSVEAAARRLARTVDVVGPNQVSRNPAEPTIAAVRGADPTAANIIADLAGAVPSTADSMRQGVRALFGDATGFTGMRDDALRRAGQIQLEESISNPEIEDPTLRAVYGGAKSAAQMIPGLGLSAVAGPAAGLALLGAQTGLPKYAELRNEGVAPLRALGNAAAQGSIEAGTELFALQKLMKLFGAPGFRTAVGLLAADIPGEQIATLGQNLFDAVARADKDPTAIERFKAEIGDNAYATLISTLTQAALMTGAAKGAQAIRGEQPRAPSTPRELSEAFGFVGAPRAAPPPDRSQPIAPPPADRPQPIAPEQPTDIASLLSAIQQSVPQENADVDRVPGPADLADVRGQAVDGRAGVAPAGAVDAGRRGPAAPAPVEAGPGSADAVPPVPRADGPDAALGSQPEIKPENTGPVLQNRDRSSAASIRQMNAIAANPDPQRLSFSREFATGAPVVFANGDALNVPAPQMGRADTITDANGKKYSVQYAVLEADDVLTSNRADGSPVKMYGLDNPGLIRTVAGNARMAGLQAAYERGTTAPYVEGIRTDASLTGVDPSVLAAMNKPVLVRIMRSADVTGNIGDVSNQSGVSSLNATEQATTDAGRVDFGALEFDDNGLPTLQSVMAFVRNMPEAEQGGLLVGKGQPAKQASERLMAATFAKAYGDPALVELYAQATDPEAKTVLGGLAQAAGAMARLEDVEGQLDFRPWVVQAARIAVNAARQGVSISKLAQQVDIETPAEAQQLLAFFAANSRSSRKIGDGLRNAAEFAYSEGTKAGTDMFGAVERASPAQVLERVGNEQAIAVGEPAGPAPYEADAGRGRRAAEGEVPAAARATETGAEGQELLTNPTPDDLRRRDAQQQRTEKEKQQREAAPPPEDFRLTGSDRIADTAEAAGQTSLFERDRRDAYTQELDLSGREPAAARPAGPADRDRGTTRTVSTVVAKEIPGATKPRPRVLHKSIADQFEQGGVLALVGTTVETHEDLAQAAQIYRDPRYETFRFILTKGNKVVHEQAVSSRMPGATGFVPSNHSQQEYLEAIREAMRQHGADGYWLMHNHPSGQPFASAADRSVTAAIAKNVKGFQGHVIINSGQYGFIEAKSMDFGRNIAIADSAYSLRGYAGDQILRRPDLPGWMYQTIDGPKDVAVIGKGLQRPDHVAVLGRAHSLKLRMAAEIPVKLLDDPVKAAAWMRRLGITGGGGELFLYHADPSTLSDAQLRTIDSLHERGFISDLVTGDGNSVTGVSPRRGDFGRDSSRSAREVAREERPPYESQTPATQKLWHRGDESLPSDPAQLTPEQRKIFDSIGTADNLSAADRAIETRARIKIAVRGWPAIEREYDALPESEGGKILNTDTARELFNDYLADRSKAAAVHEPASSVIKALFRRKLSRGPKPGQDPVVLFTSGGTGAGKSTGMKQFEDAAYIKGHAFMVYDTNVADAAKGIEKMQQALDSSNTERQMQAGSTGPGREAIRIYVMHTVREPVEALTGGALPRAENQAREFGSGRTVPLAEHVKTHVGSNKAIGEVVRHFAGNDRFGYSIIDNRYGKGGAKYIDLDQVPQYTSKELEPAVRQALDDAYAQGRISAATYRGFAGREPAEAVRLQGVAGADQEGRSGQSEQAQPGRARAPAEEVARETPAAYAVTNTPEFKRWFGDSKVVDEKGKPLIVYRGEHGPGSGEVESRAGSISFGSREAANLYAESPNDRRETAVAPRVMPAYLRIEKPFIDNRDDPFIDLGELERRLGRKEAARIARKFADDIEYTGNWDENFRGKYESVADLLARDPQRLGELYFDAYKLFDDGAEVARIKAAGYDGAIHVGNGETAGELEYKVFDRSQIKSAIGNRGTFDPESSSVVRERAAPYSDSFARDLQAQADWLTKQAKKAGFDDIDALAQKDPQKFITLAGQWRDEHPVAQEAVAGYASPGRAPREPMIDPITGRLKAGEKAYAALDKYVGGLLRKVGIASNAPPELRRLMRRYRADQEKAKLTAVDVLEAGKALPEAERDLLSQFVEGEVAAGVTVPQHIQLLAQQIDAAINRQTQQLVDLGLITKQQAAHWQGRYLPRFYTKDIDADGRPIALWKRALRIGIKAQHSRSRGLIEIVPADMVEAMKARGFSELKGADTQDPNLVAMWRDFTKAEREKMGEVRDGVYRFARGIMETGGDIAAARIFKSIAESKFATSSEVVGRNRGWRRVPEVEIPGTMLKRFGALSGMYVPEEIWKELEYTFRERGAFEQTFAELMALWKEGKTAMNPATHAANVVSNVLMADIAGISPLNVAAYARALKDFRGRGKWTREAIGEGLLDGNAVDELREWLPDPNEVLKHQGPRGIQALFETAAAKAIGKYTGASWYRQHARNLYGAEDAFFKLLIFTHYRQRGMDAEAAAVEANRYIFDYRDLPPLVQRIRNYAIPFVSYTYKAIPAIVHAWLTRPWVMAKYAAIFNGLNALAYALGGDDDEDYERRMMPSYMQGWSPLGFPSHIRVMDDRAGNPQFLNVGRLSPLGTLFQTTNGEGFNLPQAFMPSHPLMQAVLTLGWNVDTLTGKDFFKPSDDTRDRAFKTARYLMQQFGPAMPLFPGSYGFDKLAQGVAGSFDAPVDIPELGISYTGQSKFGQEESLPRAVGQTVFGVNVRGFDPARAERMERLTVRKELQEITGNIRAIQRDGTIGPETKRARIEREQSKRAKLLERLNAGED